VSGVAHRRLLRGLALAALAALASTVCASSASSASRIVGGAAIQIQAAPWTVFVEQQVASGGFLCTGSIVDPSHILTAAHCVYDDNGNLASPSQLTVKAGVSNFSTPSSTDVEQDRTVTAIRVHPGYVWTGNLEPDDVAVLSLSSAIDVSGPAAQTIALPSPNAAFPANATVGIAGFGKQTPTAAASGSLSWTTATVNPRGSCSSSPSDGLIENNGIVLCATSPSSAVCNGDSGSGLVTTTDPKTLIAVTNGVAAGCNPGSPGSFTYVGAPENLDFVKGHDRPPSAPREMPSTTLELEWDPPLAVGNTLSCSTGGWNGATGFVFSFIDTTSGQMLQSGAHPRFLIPAADAGATVQCRVAASNDGGTTLAETTPTSAVHAAPKVRIGPVAARSGVRGHTVTLRVLLHSPAGLYGKFGVCAVPPKPVGGKFCSSQSNILGIAGTYLFNLSFRIRPTSPLVTTHVAIDVVAGLATAETKALLHITRS
jgi:hypothetical protein